MAITGQLRFDQPACRDNPISFYLRTCDMLNRDLPIFVTGHRGMVGSALLRQLSHAGFNEILTASRAELDLREQAAVDAWFDDHRPAYVIHAAGTVGGIQANRTRPAEFLYDNLMIHATVLQAAYRTGVEKLLYLGSSCIYPRDCPQPIREEYLLTGPLEKTNEAYAVAKIAGLKSCEAYRKQYGCHFIAAMPTNLYGPNDNFDLTSSHVVPALIRKFHDARSSGAEQVVVWGSGKPRREFLYVDDLADACLFLMNHYDDESAINVGCGEDLTIAELASLIRDVICPGVEITFDASMPDGTPRKLLDVSRLHALGWRYRTPLAEGIVAAYQWYCSRLPVAAAG
jgi:GDP-L-fucose synthase